MTAHADDGETPWLDEAEPFEPEVSRRQIEGVLGLARPSPRRVADLGCGAGRLLVPLAEEGHRVTGVDHRAEAIGHCRGRLEAGGLDATLIEEDFLGAAAWGRDVLGCSPAFEVILCTGNTIMMFVDIGVMVDLMARVRRHLAPDGLFVIDDCPAEFWPLVTDGSWRSGLDESGSLQLVWHPSDTIFALRQDAKVDDESWELKPDDRCFRLWTDGQLALAAQVAGLSAPRRVEGANLLTLRPAKAR